MNLLDQDAEKGMTYLLAHKRILSSSNKDHDSHISISMPDGTTVRSYIPFQVYATDEGGQIVRLDFAAFTSLALIVGSHLDPTGAAAQVIKSIHVSK
jgi:hypothetical protein